MIIPFTTKLQEQMEQQLATIDKEAENTLQNAALSITVVRDYIGRLRDHLQEHAFTRVDEEIVFFRKVQPQFYKHLIYNKRLYFIETQKPVDSSQEKKFLQQERKRLKHHYNQYKEFYIYYRSGATILDEQFFLRGKEELFLSIGDYADLIDSRFCTPYSYLVAKILANAMLAGYIDRQVGTPVLTNPTGATFSKDTITWTASKVALVELTYAIYSAGVIHPTTDVKKIAEKLSRTFNITLDNIYKTYEEIRLRKKNRTPFLQTLIQSLNRKMDFDDENAG